MKARWMTLRAGTLSQPSLAHKIAKIKLGEEITQAALDHIGTKTWGIHE